MFGYGLYDFVYWSVQCSGSGRGYLVENLPGVAIGPSYTQVAVNTYFPSMGGGFVALSLFFFAYTTIMSYYYFGETNLSFLTSTNNKWLVLLLRLLMLGATFYSSIKTTEIAWELTDIGVGLMTWLNVVATILLQKPALRAWKDYQAQRRAGVNPVFNPKKLGIQNTKVWKTVSQDKS